VTSIKPKACDGSYIQEDGGYHSTLKLEGVCRFLIKM
jgi:hypothetical protein